MADTGILYATGASNNTTVGTQTWNNPTNCIGNFATQAASASGSAFNLVTYYMQYDFTSGLSAGDTVVGMVFAFRRAGDGGNSYDNSVKILLNAASTPSYSPTDKASGNSWANGSSTNLNWSSDYGGATDMWGYTAGSLNGGMSFSVVVSCEIGDKHDSAYIGIARLTIYYTPAGSSTVKKKVIYCG